MVVLRLRSPTPQASGGNIWRLTVRDVAASLHISKSEAGRLRIKAAGSGLIALSEAAGTVEQEAGETTSAN